MGKNNGQPGLIERSLRWIGEKGNKYIFPTFLRLAGTFGFLFNWNQGFSKILPALLTTAGWISICWQTIAFSVPPLLLHGVRELSMRKRNKLIKNTEETFDAQELVKKYNNTWVHLSDVLGAMDTSFQYLGIFMLGFTYFDVYEGDELNPSGHIAKQLLWDFYIGLTLFSFAFGFILGYSNNRQVSDKQLKGFMLKVKECQERDERSGGLAEVSEGEYTTEQARIDFWDLKQGTGRKMLLNT